ncbi:methyl-accepting chemotaxis protein [Pyxidicoccus fallax]|uniref:Methyl-accepting chemotaxis protein n=1 Tax=Pyxidicoccus fallax TaxID=394095 RepID=A0A848LAT7_9BACT|nr:methyl-accepting chemotaxis protein [Pyxidicoccus fallax]NMO13965.1 methyl-accepting chemotaxis protein [Pyxidicoccus fallax]NPC76703.1 methyl-accepting chemotaxis protein [Pyxidicoccus fallax]
MKRQGVERKFLVAILGLLLLLLCGQGLFLVRVMRGFYESTLRTRATFMADLLSNIGQDSVSYYNLRNLDLLTTQAARDPEIAFVGFVDENGRPLTQQESPPAEPVGDASLLSEERVLVDGEGRKLGAMRVYFSREALQENTRSGIALVVVYLVISLLAAGLGVVLLTRRLLRPVRELTHVAETVVRTGDLRQPIGVESDDEIGRLAAAFAAMMAKMREALGSLQTSSRRLDASVGELTTVTTEQAETLTRQAGALQETHTTANEIQQTSTMAAEKARSVLEVMERADQVSSRGEAAVDNGVQRLEEIREQVQQMTGRISRLSERAQQIAGITDTVKELADQSNMLALNAAIEAVRSGEQGRGFGVVAREIRSLADQSIQATSRVREVLDDITSAIHETVSMTQQGMQRIETGLVEVRATGDSLRELSAIVKENSAAARQISSAVTQQSAGVHQVFLALGELQKMMEASLRGLESTRLTANGVSEVSRSAASVVEQYQV